MSSDAALEGQQERDLVSEDLEVEIIIKQINSDNHTSDLDIVFACLSLENS